MFSTTRGNRLVRSRAPRFIAITTGTAWYSSGQRGNLRDDNSFSSNAVALTAIHSSVGLMRWRVGTSGLVKHLGPQLGAS